MFSPPFCLQGFCEGVCTLKVVFFFDKGSAMILATNSTNALNALIEGSLRVVKRNQIIAYLFMDIKNGLKIDRSFLSYGLSRHHYHRWANDSTI